MSRTFPRFSRAAFSLLELLVAMVILSTILLISFSVMEQTVKIWRQSMGTLEAFQGARSAFDSITRNIGQATLNTYLDYDDPDNPQRYLRKSELQFVIGETGAGGLPGTPNTGTGVFFQAPLAYTADTAAYGGMDGALNVGGYYVAFGEDTSLPPHVTSAPGYTPRYRYRLMNLLVPTEDNKIFDNISQTASNFDWFRNKPDFAFPLAENIIAFVVHPEVPDDPTVYSSLGLNTLDGWKSNPQPVTANQLPPVLSVTIVAIDESSAIRLENGADEPARIASALTTFQTDVAAKPRDISKALENLESKLADARINFRVFTTKIPMRESKWSKN
ncbi:MAG: prepilin-type N-terminal cleavage/methylation domain-containing protein [Chthoniobacterales bacterium]